MTQDLMATLIAMGTAALLVVRWWRRRRRAGPACANCESNTTATPRPAAGAGGPDVKPVAFFGSSRRNSK